MALFPGLPGWAGTRKVKTNLDFTEARDSEWQWHQLGICKFAPRSRQITTLAPHHSVFLQAGCPSCHPTNSVKTLKGKTQYNEEEWGIESSSVLNRWVFRETGIKLRLKLAKWTMTISYRIVSYRIRAWYCWSALTDRRHTDIHLTTRTIVKRKAWIWGADGRSVSRRHWWWANGWVFRWDLNELKL